MSEPSLYDELVSVIGADAALMLCRVRGGARISIPANVPPGHWLETLLGREAALALAQHYRVGSPSGVLRGVELDLPRGPSGVMAETVTPTLARARQVMAAAMDGGASAETAARAAGMTRRSAYRLAKRLRKDPRQGDLF